MTGSTSVRLPDAKYGWPVGGDRRRFGGHRRARIVYRQNQADDPDDVARFALEHLARGPVAVVPSMMERFKTLATTDRRWATGSNGALVMGNTKNARR
jgi:hypothetical protein